MSRIEELRKPVWPIAERLKQNGYTMTDLASIGILLIRDWEPNKISRYIKAMRIKPPLDADSVIAAAESDAEIAIDGEDKKRKRVRPPLKAG